GHGDRLAAVLADCEPACLLTDTASLDAVRTFGDDHGLTLPPVVPVDGLPYPFDGSRTAGPPGAGPSADTAPAPAPAPDDIAYLQYTSGSTRSPAGVMITHANVVANARQAIEAFHADADCSTTVGWLPLFHDMGLVLSVAAPVVGGFPTVLMDPVAFLEQPSRWLRLLGSYPGTISAAPNFAFDYCAARTDPGTAAGMRLHRVKALINGSEPVRPGTVDRFQRAFADAGLSPEAHCPSYGLAEATVFVTNDSPASPPGTVPCDPAALARGRVVAVDASDESAAHLVGCGTPAGQRVRIADPATGLPLPDGGIGEILVSGPNVGLGYWKRPEAGEGTFGVRLPGDSGSWLRTGDLGSLHEGQLLVIGRLKDLLIVDGRNHYPQDIEETVQSALNCVRRDRLAAFSVPGDDRPGENGEQVIVVAEHRRDTEVTDLLRAAAARAARAELSARHGLRLGRLLLVPPGAVPRTSSGKISRTACRARFLQGLFAAEDPGESGAERAPGAEDGGYAGYAGESSAGRGAAR
ncbi:MAG TPA: fatty-acid--CoA ligase, partial [Streptomyces sp.]|nr:fatty-acid--CoA ligase [Streptomyces sp.]